MATAIRVLYVDDEPGLLDIGKVFLEQSGDFTVTTATSAPEAIRLLEQERFDAIVSDYQMPEMDGIQFLVLVRTKFGQIPFILFTGKGREEVVIQAINSGADFYLQRGSEPKSQLAELSHKIKSAASRKMAEDSLKKSEENFRSIFENNSSAIAVIEPDTTISMVNEEYCKMSGYTKQEVIGMSWTEQIPPEDLERLKEFNRRRLINPNDAPDKYEFTFYKKNGEIKHALMSIVIIQSKRIIASFIDITERKRAEEALTEAKAFTESALNSIFDIFYSFDLSGKFLSWNKTFNRISGYSDQELSSKKPMDFFLGEDIQRIAEAVERIYKEGTSKTEANFVLKDGRQIPCEFTGSILKDGRGNIIGFSGTGRDITERKRAEDELRKSEERFRSYFNMPLHGIAITSPDKGWIEVNDRICSILGYTRDELFRMNWAELTHPDDLAADVEQFNRVLSGQIEQYAMDKRFILKDGGIIWTNITVGCVRKSDGCVDYIIGLMEDITERKRVDLELVSAYKRLKEAHRLAHIGTWDWVMENDTVTWSEELYNIAGRDPSLPAPTYAEHPHIYTPASWDILSCAVTRALDTGESYNLELELVRQDGSIREVNAFGGVKRDGNGKVIGLHGTVQDITERKRSEVALVESEGKYRTLVETTGTGFVIIDDQGQVLDANLEYVHLTGHMSLEEIVGRNVIEWTAAYERDKNAKAVSQCMTDGYIRNLEIDYVNASGTIIPIEINATVLRSGDAVQILTLCRDITERKRSEVALRESEAFNRGLVENLPDYLVVYGTDGKILYVNPAAERVLGYDTNGVVGTHVISYVAEECRDEATANIAARHTGREIPLYELDIIAQDGLRRSVIAKGTPIQYHNSPAILILLIDITERKRVEGALVVSEARFRDRTVELSATNLKLEKEIGDRIKIQKKLILSATEKDLLLREVHHRVKNNLQLIIGLIDMTKTRAHEPVVLSTLTSIMAKVQTMGLVHTQLYESKRVDKVSMKRQVQDLVDMISGFYDHEHHDITTNINCPDIYLPVDLAIPCALALNEIISNIHKHAFKGKRNGLVEISLSVKGDQLRIAVRDNGVGLPSGFDIEKSNRLGLKLMRTLVEQQLHGNVQITSKAGTEVVIEFCIRQRDEDYGTGTGS